MEETKEYKGVRKAKRQSVNSKSYFAQKIIDGETWRSPYYETEREAAKAYDLYLISQGIDPVNVLKRKQ